MAPRGVRIRRHVDLIEVVDGEIDDTPTQRVEHKGLASGTRSEEQEEHAPNLTESAPWALIFGHGSVPLEPLEIPPPEQEGERRDRRQDEPRRERHARVRADLAVRLRAPDRRARGLRDAT